MPRKVVKVLIIIRIEESIVILVVDLSVVMALDVGVQGPAHGEQVRTVDEIVASVKREAEEKALREGKQET